MNKNEFKNLMAAIHSAYPNEKITDDKNTVMLWWNMLSDREYRAISRNLEKHIKTCKFVPTIAELRAEPPKGFSNFAERTYDMKKLERALLGIEEVKGVEEIT